MADNVAKINIKVGELEISIEGPSEFVSNHYEKVKSELSGLSELGRGAAPEAAAPAAAPVRTGKGPGRPRKNKDAPVKARPISKAGKGFSMWLSVLPTKLTAVDTSLLAGYYVQMHAKSKTFKVREVSRLLKENGIRLTNPSASIKRGVEQKRIVADGKLGNQVIYKFTKTGNKAMDEILQASGAKK